MADWGELFGPIKVDERAAIAHPGDIVFLHLPEDTPRRKQDLIRDAIKELKKEYGIGVVLLIGDIEVARIEAPEPKAMFAVASEAQLPNVCPTCGSTDPAKPREMSTLRGVIYGRCTDPWHGEVPEP